MNDKLDVMKKIIVYFKLLSGLTKENYQKPESEQLVPI